MLSNVSHENFQEIVKKVIIGEYGVNGYASIIKTAIKKTRMPERQILISLDNFQKAIEFVYGEVGAKKILDPVVSEIHRLDESQLLETRKIIDNAKPDRILVADDETKLLEIYHDWFKLNNKQVTTTENGLKCLKIYQKESKFHSPAFDVVILDYKMPVLDGLETAKRIFQINSNQRIIFATGYLKRTLIDSLKSLGKPIEMIKKPFSIQTLDDLINKKKLLLEFDKLNSKMKEKHFELSEYYDNALLICKKEKIL